ncbi:hypothetical protein OG889_40375 [Streptomyces sp. NBC_00481]|uniref:hypothetical protein n=1 Tax=unclassified Streptomyces TaxID=2593676 RepID=UPI002DD95FFD|nr:MULTISPECIES: hypothetical protein [unclassified Streptomyces]WRZ00393.1 hypothetical protein OG889_40375 [Streptomyces sp. NBC_00481]
MKPAPPIARALPRLALYAVLASYGGATLLRQVNPEHRFPLLLEKWGVTVPIHRFFGPIPSVHDSQFLIRHHFHGGRTEPWRELVFRQDRHLRHMVWAPQRRMDKGLFDLVAALTAIAGSTQDMRRIASTIPYQSLLNVALYRIEHPHDARATQFAIGRSAGLDLSVTPQVVFASDLHELETARTPRVEAVRRTPPA